MRLVNIGAAPPVETIVISRHLEATLLLACGFGWRPTDALIAGDSYLTAGARWRCAELYDTLFTHGLPAAWSWYGPDDRRFDHTTVWRHHFNICRSLPHDTPAVPLLVASAFRPVPIGASSSLAALHKLLTLFGQGDMIEVSGPRADRPSWDGGVRGAPLRMVVEMTTGVRLDRDTDLVPGATVTVDADVGAAFVAERRARWVPPRPVTAPASSTTATAAEPAAAAGARRTGAKT